MLNTVSSFYKHSNSLKAVCVSPYYNIWYHGLRQHTPLHHNIYPMLRATCAPSIEYYLILKNPF